jgi:hypothetical protein
MDEAKKEGLQLASQSILLRRGVFGSNGPRVADSIFFVSRMMAGWNEHNMSRDMEKMHGQLMRALWFLASFEDILNDPEAGKKYRNEANEEGLKLTGREGWEAPDEDTDDACSVWSVGCCFK